MTEEEAKTKWCPMMAHHALECDETCRRKSEEYAPGIVAARCIASACMAWQWRVSNYPESGGYCGLAGKP